MSKRILSVCSDQIDCETESLCDLRHMTNAGRETDQENLTKWKLIRKVFLSRRGITLGWGATNKEKHVRRSDEISRQSQIDLKC